jgi:signal recognition particle subunit SRP54
MADRILDMGDVLTLIEQAEKAFDAEQAASVANRLMGGEGLTLEDFIEQLGMLRKLGPLKNILGLMPGAAKNKELLDQVNEKDLDRAEAIVRSMTPAERRNPKIINGSRRLRIANGSGVSVGEVGTLVTRFFEAQRQMKMVMGGGMPGIPGMPGMRGGKKAAAQAKAARNAKGKRKSGDPRKAGLTPAPASGAAPTGGAPAPAAAAAPQSMEELAEMLRDAQAAGGPPSFGDDGEGFPGFRGSGPSSLPPAFGGGRAPGGMPAAFGRRDKKKKLSGTSPSTPATGSPTHTPARAVSGMLRGRGDGGDRAAQSGRD